MTKVLIKHKDGSTSGPYDCTYDKCILIEDSATVTGFYERTFKALGLEVIPYEEPKKTKELWLWVFSTQLENPYIWSRDVWTHSQWMTEDEANELAKRHPHWTFHGKSPTCLKPLVVEG